MNPLPDDHSDGEVPLTRAGLDTPSDLALRQTEIDPEQARPGFDGDRSWVAVDPMLTKVPTVDVPEGLFSGKEVQQPIPQAEGSNPKSSRRGIVGKIEPGQTLYSKYLVKRKLGGGAMGDVWLVRHATLKSEHALKVIVPNFARNAVALMRFQREFEVMASLRHEHAVTIYDASIDDEGGYIDMEYVDGLTIDAILASARSRPDRDPTRPLMPLDWIVRILEQLSDVLQAAHEKGIVHRDLKPSNIMLLNGRKPGKEYLKVLDFGIAKVRDDPDSASAREHEENSNRTEGFIGTPSYGSPEQAMAQDDIDGRADLYSVGIMLYEFITGRLPFRGSPLMVMSQNATAPPPPFRESSPKLRSMPEVEYSILRVLSKEREKRPQTARQLFEEFREAVAAVLQNGSPNSPPMSGVEGPAQFPTTSVQETEHESQIGGPSLPSTMAATLVDRREQYTELQQLIEPTPLVEPSPVRLKHNTSRMIISVISGASIGLLALALTLNFRFGSKPPAPPIIPTEKTARFEELWSANFVAVDAAGKSLPWPEQVRQTPEDRYFNRFADGIYLPDGFAAEDPKQLINGWPAAIVREKIRFVRIEGGKEWTMGAWDVEVEPGRSDVPAHVVKLEGFYLQETEVTNGQYESYLERSQSARPTEWERVYLDLKKVGSDLARQHPAVNLSRKQAQAFARSIDAQLPTEAQWEYAARSRGEKRRFVWGESPPPSRMMANIDAWDAKTTAPVRSFPDDKTPQGVFDMLGNVQEFCRDAYAPYKKGLLPELDPCETTLETSKATFVVRGANFNSLPQDCSVTRRDDRRPETEFAENIGFRLVVECPAPTKPR